MSAPETPPSATRPQRSRGVGLILAGVAVFVVCSIVQAAGGSSMFSRSYLSSHDFVMDLLMNITWWPGWVLTVGLIVSGVRQLITRSGS
jgi:hypothetical protein